MKKRITLLSILLCALFLTISCSKKDDAKSEVQIDEKNLTACPVKADCHNVFQVVRDYGGISEFKSGNKLVFSNIVRYSDPSITYTLDVSAPVDVNSFSLGKADVLNGKITWNIVCPACNTIAYQAIDGYAKGRKLSSGDGVNETKWIVEAKLVLQAAGNPSSQQTVYVKQYFYQAISIDGI